MIKNQKSPPSIAYLLWKEGCKKSNVQDTLKWVQEKRSISKPNKAFMKQLIQWEINLKQKNNLSCYSYCAFNTIKDINELAQQMKSTPLVEPSV